MTRFLLSVCAVALVTGCSQSPPASESSQTSASVSGSIPGSGAIAGIPAGDYRSDPAHSSVTFKVKHMGFSYYTAGFKTMDATLKLDPARPDQAQVTASVDAASLDLPTPPKGFHSELMTDPWFSAAAHPKITFVSRQVVTTGPQTARVTGDMTLRGVTKPVTFDATFNGGYPGFAMDPQARIGFSLTGRIKRSDFGMSYGIPAPGSEMGVADDVDIAIETEMLGPPFKP